MNELTVEQVFEARRATDMHCNHGLIVANRGEGRHFLMKFEIEDIIKNTADDVIVFDVFGEFGPEMREIGGKTRSITHNGENYFNPLVKWNCSEDMMGTMLSEKNDMIVAMAKSLKIPMSDTDIVVLSKTIANLYETVDFPSMMNLIALLKAEKDNPSLVRLGYDLDIHRCFAEKSNIDLTERLLVINISCLSSFFRYAGVVSLLEYLLCALREKHLACPGKRTWLYIPHLDALVAEDTEWYFVRFWRRARRFGIVCTGLVRKDFTKEQAFAPLWQMSEALYLMVPSVEDKDWFEIMDIEPEGFAQMMYSVGRAKGSLHSLTQSPCIEEHTKQ